MVSLEGRHHQQDIVLQCARWVGHYAPRIETAFRNNKKRPAIAGGWMKRISKSKLATEPSTEGILTRVKYA